MSNAFEIVGDTFKALAPFAPLYNNVPTWVRFIFNGTLVMIIVSSILFLMYQENIHVQIGPRTLRFQPKEGTQHRKFLQVNNDLEIPVYSVRAFALLSGAEGKDLDIDLIRDPQRPTRRAEVRPEETMYIFPVRYENQDAILIFIYKLNAKTRLKLSISARKPVKMKFQVLEWQREDPGVQLSPGGLMEANFIRPAALKNKVFTLQGMKVILLQPE